MATEPLPPEDQRHVDAADGWLSLGNRAEARRELGRVGSSHQCHPDVLQARWLVGAKAGRWDVCLEIASALTQIVPERRSGWLRRAHSLAKMGRIAEAKEVLLLATRHCPPDCSIPFHLAACCLQLGQVQESVDWLDRAIQAEENHEELRRSNRRAVAEAELEPHRKRMGRF